MPDIDDLLAADGARWRADIDRESVAPPLETLPRDPVLPIHGARRRPSLTPWWLSAAAITVAVLVIGGGVVLASRTVWHGHRAPRTLGAVHQAPTPSSQRSTVPASPATTPAATGHRKSAPNPHRASSRTTHEPARRTRPVRAAPHVSSAGSATGSSGPDVCAAGELTVSVSGSPASPLTVSITNAGSTECAVSGFPVVSVPSDAPVSVSQSSDTPAAVVLPPGQVATAEIDWDGGTASATCQPVGSITVAPPVADGSPSTFALDPPAQACGSASVVVHAVRAG